MQTNYTTLKIYLVLLNFFLFLFLLQLVFFFFAPFNFCGSMKQPFHHQSAIFSKNNAKINFDSYTFEYIKHII